MQCSQNKSYEHAAVILDLLPSRKESYILRQLPEDPEGTFREFIDSYSDLNGQCWNINYVSTEWLSDMTKVIDSLFATDLATEENLTVLFGRSGYVSYHIWDLHQQKKERNQTSIVSIVSRSRFWKVGCIANDTSLGPRIQYLNKADSRHQFEDIKKLIYVGNSTGYLEPSLEQFVKKVGWDNPGMESVFGSFSDFQEHTKSIGLIAKRCRYEID